jgi:hypothetical protein
MPWLPQLLMRDKIFRIARTRDDAGKPLAIDATKPPKDRLGKEILTEKYFVIDSSWERVQRLWCMAQLMPTTLQTPVGIAYGSDTAAYKRTEKPPPGEVMNGVPHVKLIRRDNRIVNGQAVQDNIYPLGDDQAYSSVLYAQGIRGSIVDSLYVVNVATTARAVVAQRPAYTEAYNGPSFVITKYWNPKPYTFYVMVFRP